MRLQSHCYARAVSTVVTAPGAAEPRRASAAGETPAHRLAPTADALLGAGLTVVLVLLAFLTRGGTDLAPNTWVQIVLTVLSGALAVTVLLLGAPGRTAGRVTLLLFALLAALTYASIAWSVQPANSWLEANRTLSYLAAFACAMALARLIPARWPAVNGALAAFATVVCAWALLVKVFPGSLDASNQLARLRAPFDYWNATGLAAAIGLPGCVWAGARPEGGRISRALSMPAIAVLLIVLILSQSRGALAAAIIGVGLWVALVPVRLRAALVLAVGAVGAAGVLLWALGQSPLVHDYNALPVRTHSGHELGVGLLIMLVVITIAGFATATAMERVTVRAPLRRRISIALLTLLALVPVAAVIALAASSRGLTGEVSHAWSSLTDQKSVVFNTPGRLAQLGSSRPRYWSEGLKVGEHALVAGTGALGYATARTRYTNDSLLVQHAHSYVIETFADLGLIGVALSLALLLAWALSVRRSAVVGERRPEHAAERGGLLALLAAAVIFGVHSLIDWTWFIPGVAIPAMIAAGWLAGRGTLAEPVGRAARRRRLLAAPGMAMASVCVVAAVALAAWMVWQPLRSANADAAAITAALRGDTGTAIADARTASASDPVSVEPLWELSAIYSGLGNTQAAHRQLTDATTSQPSNPATWVQLAQFDLHHHHPAEAIRALRRALVLDRTSSEAQQLLKQAHG
jgi:cytochrome c-type biogenesis protein CcmH/NrfG